MDAAGGRRIGAFLHGASVARSVCVFGVVFPITMLYMKNVGFERCSPRCE